MALRPVRATLAAERAYQNRLVEFLRVTIQSPLAKTTLKATQTDKVAAGLEIAGRAVRGVEAGARIAGRLSPVIAPKSIPFVGPTTKAITTGARAGTSLVTIAPSSSVPVLTSVAPSAASVAAGAEVGGTLGTIARTAATVETVSGAIATGAEVAAAIAAVVPHPIAKAALIPLTAIAEIAEIVSVGAGLTQDVIEIIGVVDEIIDIVDNTFNFGESVAETEMRKLADDHKIKFTSSMGKVIPDIQFKLSDVVMDEWLNGKISENVNLIKGMTKHQLEVFRARLNKLLAKGEFDRQAVAKAATDSFRIGNARAKLIGRDQVSKAMGELNRIRQTEVGITKYRWLTSGDDRVRTSHREINGDIFLWSNPPSFGHPGQDFNCRCVAVPII